MNIDSFRYLIAVEEYGSISSASRHLFITQPALTKQILKLESELGGRLFNRNSRPISFTALGKTALRYAHQMVRLYNDMLEELDAQLGQQNHTIRIACTLRGSGILMGLLQKLQADEWNLTILDGSADECEQWLLEEKCDLAFLTTPLQYRGIEVQVLEEDPLAFLLPESYQPQGPAAPESPEPGLLAVYTLLPQQLESFLFIMSKEGHSMFHAQKAFLEQSGIHPKKLLYVDQIDVGARLALGGVGAVLAPQSTAVALAKQGHTSRMFTVQGFPLSRQVVAAKKASRQLGHQAQTIWELCVKRSAARGEVG